MWLKEAVDYANERGRRHRTFMANLKLSTDQMELAQHEESGRWLTIADVIASAPDLICEAAKKDVAEVVLYQLDPSEFTILSVNPDKTLHFMVWEGSVAAGIRTELEKQAVPYKLNCYRRIKPNDFKIESICEIIITS